MSLYCIVLYGTRIEPRTQSQTEGLTPSITYTQSYNLIPSKMLYTKSKKPSTQTVSLFHRLNCLLSMYGYIYLFLSLLICIFIYYFLKQSLALTRLVLNL